MPKCSGCTNTCNCRFADDGVDRLGGSYILDTGQGRRNTVVQGAGTVEDPFTVSFIDSEFYRPNSLEIQKPPSQTIFGGAAYHPMTVGNAIRIYESPERIIFDPVELTRTEFVVEGFFQFVGATATFGPNTN